MIILFLIGFSFFVATTVLTVNYIKGIVSEKDSEETLEKYRKNLEKKVGDFDIELNSEDELNFENNYKTTYL